MVSTRGVEGEKLFITCGDCGKTSYNLHDIVNNYCGNCHEYKDSAEERPGKITSYFTPANGQCFDKYGYPIQNDDETDLQLGT